MSSSWAVYRAEQMIEVAPDVHHLPLGPRDAVNAYLVGDVLVDAGYAIQAKRVLKQLGERAGTVKAHALTHAHVDHAGGSRRVLDALDVPVWVGAGDAEAAYRGAPELPAGVKLRTLLEFYAGFDGIEVDRELREGDELAAGFTVLEVPGHSPGHLAFWRETDRVLIAGDVWFHMSVLTTKVGLREPLGPFTPDPAANRRSIRRLTELEPEVVCFGHGPVLRDATPALRAFADGLPAE